MIVGTKELMAPAMQKAYAIGAFNISNLESLLAVVEAAVEETSPAIVAVTPSSIKYAGLSYLERILTVAGESVDVPMSLHLDHGKTFKIASKCIDAGFTSVMIDGSHLEFQDNVALTKNVVDLAYPKGVSVEGELGRLTSLEEANCKSRETALTDPNAAQEFIENTGVDALAVAIGTSHGAYKFKAEPKLDFDRLKLIRRKISTPLVLHGASSVPYWLVRKAIEYGAKLTGAKGVPEPQVQEAISLGITKINIDTDLRIAFTASIREFLHKNPETFDPRKILDQAKGTMKNIVRGKMRLFGSSGKAPKK